MNYSELAWTTSNPFFQWQYEQKKFEGKSAKRKVFQYGYMPVYMIYKQECKVVKSQEMSEIQTKIT